jgi:hypothetical protein
MKKLKDSFRLNGLPYTLLKRNDVVALYGIGGTNTDQIKTPNRKDQGCCYIPSLMDMRIFAIRKDKKYYSDCSLNEL